MEVNMSTKQFLEAFLKAYREEKSLIIPRAEDALVIPHEILKTVYESHGEVIEQSLAETHNEWGLDFGSFNDDPMEQDPSEEIQRTFSDLFLNSLEQIHVEIEDDE